MNKDDVYWSACKQYLRARKDEVVSYYYNGDHDVAITSSGVIVHYYGDGDIGITVSPYHIVLREQQIFFS